MPGQDLARAFARKVTQVARAIRLPFIDAASVCDFGIDEIALHALQGLLAPEEMAGRELLLLQASDWPFVITRGQAIDYGIKRFVGHVGRFGSGR